MANKNMMTTTQAPHGVNIYLQKQALKTIDKFIVHARWGQDATLPQNEGDTMKWIRWSALLAQTTPLTEGEDPNPILATRNDLSVQLQEYGAWMQLTSKLKMTGLKSTQAQLAERLAKQMALTIDTLCRDVIAGNTSTTTCSNGSGTATLPNKTDIDTITKTLYSAGAETMTARIGAAMGQGTSPQHPAYIGIAHTDAMIRLQNVSGFLAVKNYANPGSAYPYEWGQTGMVRWILTNNGYTSGSNYYAPIIGQEAFGNIKLKAGDNPLIQTPGTSPLGRWSTVGWNKWYAGKILNDLLIHTMIHTV
jgi:N4-gp56 family major capsid protein